MQSKIIKIKIINYLINPINLKDLLKKIVYWKKNKYAHYICVSNVHSCRMRQTARELPPLFCDSTFVAAI